ncbi:TPA: hypothetical protein ACH3X2_009751 [Trebouxia sp. C0005]
MTATLFVRRFTDTDRIVQAFAAFPSALLVVTERSVQRWQEREGELVRFEDTHLAAPVLLALTHLQQNNLTLLVIAGSNSHSGLRTYNLVWVGSSSQSLSQIPVTVPHLLNGGGVVKRETMPQASQAVLTGASSDCLLCSASLYQGWVHVMAMTPHPNPVSCNEVVTALHSFCEEAADQFQGGDCRVQSMAFESTAVHQETIFLMCLVSFTGFNHSCKEIHCLDVNLSQPDPLKNGIKAGPWVLRNVDPTTTLVHPISSDDSNNKGVLAISSHSIHLLSAADANSHPVLTCRLAGLPTAIVHLKGSMWALADSMAGLHLLDLRQPCSLLQLKPQIPLTVAHVLCCLPGSDADIGVGANLLLGSRTANSQLVSLPAALLNRPADWSASQLSADQPHTSWQASASVTVQKPAVIDSAAAIHAACVFQEPKGCGEWRMVMGCGVAPRGSLRLTHLAAKLSPTISDGPCMPGGPRLMALKADWRQEHHAYLAFSFPSEGTTSVLDIQGTHFQPIHLPGLDPNSPSLLLEALPGGWLIQVTPEEVRVLNNTGLIGAWGSADTLSMAASCGSLIAAAHGSSVTVINIDAATGEPNATKTLHFSEQVSAVALLKMPHAVAAEEPEHWLIVGLWTEDTVLLQRLSDDRHSCSLDCSDVGQPRSILAAEMHGTWFLFVGTSQGWVVYHAITWQAGKMQLEGGCKVHAGVSGVQLSYLPSHSSTSACLYVQSSKALLLRPAASSKASGNKAGLVEAVRMHGGDGVMGGVGVHTLDLPNSLAWLSPKEELTFGDVDHTMQLRWFTLGLEDTPHCVACHTTSGHVAVLSTSPSGASWLRLVHATTLTQVAALQLGKGHTATAICCARLPTSSVTALHHLPGRPPAEKEFVVVASYISQPKASQNSNAGPARRPSQGLLSVFEVCTAGTAGQTAAAANNRSQLRLHGTCRLQSLCYSLATAPACDGATATSKARSSDSGLEVVVAGCEGEVHLYSLFIDDTAQAGRQAVATACQALAQGEPLPDQASQPHLTRDVHQARQPAQTKVRLVGQTKAVQTTFLRQILLHRAR